MTVGKLDTPHLRCPQCDHLLDGYAAVDGGDKTPQPDDITVCAYCLVTLEFHTRWFRIVTKDELSRMEPEVQEQVATITALLAKHWKKS